MLSEIRESRRASPEAATREVVVRDGAFIEDKLAQLQGLEVPFSGEECLGRYFDLHQLYNRYVNSEFGSRVSYIDYLSQFPAVDDETISSRMKRKKEYEDYIAEVLEYLVSFVERAHPLMFLDRVFKNVEAEFEEEWEEKPDKGRKRPRNDKEGRRVKETALMEAKVKKLCQLLNETLERTVEHVSNRQAMTRKEADADVADHDSLGLDAVEEDEGDDDGGVVYNPLKLPLGSDGKPIPYWLYKLQGLGQKFNCEICGDHGYKGRREFEMHFKGKRHERGMRCLNIPNTKSFHEITSIEAARKLWAKMEMSREANMWRPDLYEEFEDAEGNVYDSKTYAHLTRQGLI
ncbi:hypothetical protein vseg_001640 [Gypsophila vaccaria]